MRPAACLNTVSAPTGEMGPRGPKPLDNAPIAILAAAAAGAMGCAIQFMLMTGGLTGAGASLGTALWFGVFVFVITWVVAALGFAIGLLFVGLPAWAGFDKLGWMSPGLAAASGAILAPLVAGLFGGLPSAAFLLLPGALAGWILHRVAYSKSGSPS